MSSLRASRRPYHLSPLRQRLARETRTAILNAARELFLAQGYGATTIDQIADRAGVSKPTVFTAVGNKQAVLKLSVTSRSPAMTIRLRWPSGRRSRRCWRSQMPTAAWR